MQSKTERIEKLKQLAKEASSQGREAAVIELFECYLEYFPNDSRAWFLFSDAQRLLGKFASARVSLRNAERLCAPDRAWEVQCRIGLAFHGSGDFSAAERLYAQALESDEARQASWLWMYRGVNFTSQELLDKAEECYRQAIAVDEAEHEGQLNLQDEAYFNLALVYRTQGRYEEAKKAAETALELCPDYPDAEKFLQSLEGAIEARMLVDRLRRLDFDE